jgi:hypothetical protein
MRVVELVDSATRNAERLARAYVDRYVLDRPGSTPSSP